MGEKAKGFVKYLNFCDVWLFVHMWTTNGGTSKWVRRKHNIDSCNHNK